MAEKTVTDIFAFNAEGGGMGKRLSVTTSSSSGAIPGTIGKKDQHLLVTNSGSVPAHVAFGQSSIIATTDCLEVLPGTQIVLSAPFTLPRELYVAAITVAGSTTIQVTAGAGV